MDFKALLDFLHDLAQNNNKSWMDANRKRYHQVRDMYIAWLEDLNTALITVDGEYYDTPGRKGINRINNNLMFHPNKPTYKDHFGAGLDKRPNTADFYLEIGLKGTVMAGGLWRPDAKTLKSVRDAIDYDGAELIKIMNKKSFIATFGELYQDERLVQAPKGFANDHQHIELLRNKTFAVVHQCKNELIYKADFKKKVLSVYEEMLPFRRYLNKAITV